MPTRVLLARHGRTAWNDEGRVQGWAPVPLDDVGREQATALGEHLAATEAVDHVVASDLRRTVETARRIRRSVDAPLTVDRDWRERDFGVLQGLDGGTLFGEFPEFALSEVGRLAMEGTPEGGESLLDARERVLGAWDRLGDDHEGETVLVVTHGGPIRLVLAHLLGRDLVEAVADRDLANCSVSTVEIVDGEPRVRGENETAFLE